jgi:RNA polymerase sigma-70 factor (ECF subfamily)
MRGWTRRPDSSSGTRNSRDAWLHRLTVNACLDAARHRRRRVREVELTPTTDIPIPDGSILQADRDQLDHALGLLEPDLRAIVVLHYYLDLTLPETSDALRVPVGTVTVKSRLHRALAALRVTVADDGAAPPPVAQGRYA